MYKNFFGFKEKPFKLIPNPTYHFLSKSHEEAMAHLSYAVSQGDGFVEITGEVGTGKTTLCRTFLENLNDNVEVAYIFNPKLDSLQLLKAINDEFDLPSGSDSTKELIDTLNTFLMSEKSAGKIVVLLIDEAHNLDYSVLEQIRLLSNLETTKFKLLQIILVGQPELRDLLNSRKLRQLGQRITLSCSLLPLSFSETREYIQHRINIASQKPGVKFPKSAVQAIYRYSKGIPRLVNIASDRTLLTVFGMNQQRITGKAAKTAVKELTGRKQEMIHRPVRGKWAVSVFATLCLIFIVAVMYPPDLRQLSDRLSSHFGWNKNNLRTTARHVPPEPPVVPKIPIESAKTVTPEQATETPPDPPAADVSPNEAVIDTIQAAAVPVEIIEKEPVVSQSHFPETVHEEIVVQEFGEFLSQLAPLESRQAAVKAAMGLWGIPIEIKSHLNEIEDSEVFFRLAAKQSGLTTKRIQGNLELIRKLNLPAILEFFIPDRMSTAYLTVSRFNMGNLTLLSGPETRITTEPDNVKSYWSGVAYIPWKDFLNCSGEIPTSATEDSVITLKMILRDVGFTHIAIDPYYDEPAEEAVKEIQRKHGLSADGVVGTLTKIVLYNEYGTFDIPHIRVN